MWRLLLGLSVMSVVSAETLRFQPHSTSNTICPDRQGSCPSGTTCCLLQSGKYGCCPLPEATCCEDHVHCCPSAYRCDPTSGSCYQGNKTIAMVAKHEATPLIGRNSECGGDSGVKYECPDGMTCCRLKSGEWACCPLPQAVCCADGVHCCPSGYTCNRRTGSCQQAGNSNPLLTLRPSHKHMGGATSNESSSGKQSDVKMTKPLTRKRRTCPGGKSYCDGGKTCCYKDKWHFNCCPFVNGVCCNDTAHCCPLGYNCNVKLGKCTKGGVALPWGQTERSSSWTEEEQEPKEGGPSFFKTILSLLLDTFIDYEQDDDDDDEDREKAKRAKATLDTPRARSGKTTKTSTKTAAAKKVKVSTTKNVPEVSKANVKATKPETSVKKGVQKVVPKVEKPQQKVDSKLQGKVSKVQTSTTAGKTLGVAKSSVQGKKVMSEEKTPKKEVIAKELKNVKSSGSLGSKPSVDNKGGKSPAKTSPAAGKSGIKSPKTVSKMEQGKKSHSPVAVPPPKMQVKLQVKKVVEPKTSTRLDEGKPKELPPIAPRTKYKLRVKSVLKPISKPPVAPKKKVVTVKKGAAKKDLKHSVISKASDNSGKSSQKAVKLQGRTPATIKTESSGGKVPKPGTEKNKNTKVYKSVEKHSKPVVKSTKPVSPPKPSVKPSTNSDTKKTNAKSTSTLTKPKMVSKVVKPTQPEGLSLKQTGVKSTSKSKKSAVKSAVKHEIPAVTSSKPTVKQTTIKPTKTVVKLTKATVKPMKTVVKPTKTAVKPTKTAVKPTKTAVKPTKTAVKPTKTVDPTKNLDKLAKAAVKSAILDTKSSKSAIKPAVHGKKLGTVTKPITQSTKLPAKPVTPSVKPVSVKLVKPSVKPIKPSVKPTKPSVKPAKSSVQSAKPSVKPVKPSVKSVHVGVKPVKPSVKPVKPSVKSSKLSMKPVSSDVKPTKPDLKPVKPTTKSAGKKVVKPTSQTTLNIDKPKAVSGQKASAVVGKANGKHRAPIIKVIGNPKMARELWKKSQDRNRVLKTMSDSVMENALIKILPVGGDYVECPDEESRCPDGSTCCLLSSGQYGCCPLKKAVCCADHLHCCPAGTTCDPKDETCKKGDLAIPWHTKVSALPRLNMSNSTKCADEKTTCPDQTTCCAMLDGYYACCPFPNAKCCADKLHCCPSKEECDVKRGKCVAPKGQSPWVNHAPAPKVVSPVSNTVICPDGKECPADNTCCQISVGLFGCCPLKQAVCCSDHTHCCPRGYACDITAGTCTSSANGATISWYTKTEAQPRAVGTVICPDKESFCPEHTTCCLLSTKQYGCCPLPQAICCSDGVHCCPSGYTCDVKKSSCQKSTDSIPWSEKIPAEPLTYGGQWVTCPDKKSQCQDGQTCCMQQSGVFGCCPLPKAVCCSDRLHCCPEQSTCDVHAGTCSSKTNSLTISWSSIRRSSAHVPTQEQEETICEDKTRCPSGSTCCMMKSGVYGCCPYNKGVCCSDEMRCCPESFHCDKTSRRCDKIDSSLSLTSTLFTRFKPVPETRSWGGPPVVKCPGGKEKCPKGSTCCKQPSGRYGCCRYDNAVCCPDGVSCCPQGYACDVQSGTCTQSKSIPWLAKVPATHIPTVHDRAMAVKCPDKVHQCPDGSTCCKLSSGDWGCCPVPEAVCCRDGLHCCPQGYTCDPPTGACTQHTDHSKALPFLTLATSNRATSKP